MYRNVIVRAQNCRIKKKSVAIFRKVCEFSEARAICPRAVCLVLEERGGLGTRPGAKQLLKALGTAWSSGGERLRSEVAT